MAVPDFSPQQFRIVRRMIAEEVAKVRGRPQLRQTPRLHRVPPPRRFELKAALAAGGTALARFLYDDGSGNDFRAEQDGDEFTLYNPLDIFEGEIGDRGYCIYMLDSARWETWQKSCPV